MGFELIGLEQTLKDLKEFDKQANLEFRRVINSELERIKQEALALVPELPLRNWNTQPAKHPHKDVRGGTGWPAWNSAKVRAGITVTKAEGKAWSSDYTTNAGALKNADPAGMIFELAGFKHHENTPSGKAMIDRLEHDYGKGRRLVFRAVLRNREAAQRKIYDALEVAKAKLEIALNKRSSL
jgi:hypothetical protein